jgi:hypothetical protein
MNTPEYRKAYMANLALSSSNNHKNLVANKGSPSLNQYVQNSGNQVLGGMSMGGMSMGGMSMGGMSMGGGTTKKSSKKGSK